MNHHASIRNLIQTVQNNRKAGINEQNIFENFKNSLKNFIINNRTNARDIILTVFLQETDEGKMIDPSKGDIDINIWRWCWASFFELNMFYDADKIIEECYLCLLRLQKKNGNRYHKGTPLQTRADGLIRTGFPSKAKRFVILAHIEDLVTGQAPAPAEMTLRGAGISDEDLRLIESETKNSINEKIKLKDTLLYPEEVYQKIRFQIDFASVGELNKNFVFTNVEYLNELLNRVNLASEGKNKKMKRITLEELAQYLFSSIEGLYVQPSTRTSTYELDGIITNTANHPFLRTLDTYIPIECKNWNKPIGSPVITAFIAKLSLYKCNLGFLISKSGIRKSTVEELRKDAYRRLNIYVLVFDEKDIISIIKGKDIISLMIEKYRKLKFAIGV